MSMNRPTRTSTTVAEGVAQGEERSHAWQPEICHSPPQIRRPNSRPTAARDHQHGGAGGAGAARALARHAERSRMRLTRSAACHGPPRPHAATVAVGLTIASPSAQWRPQPLGGDGVANLPHRRHQRRVGHLYRHAIVGEHLVGVCGALRGSQPRFSGPAAAASVRPSSAVVRPKRGC